MYVLFIEDDQIHIDTGVKDGVYAIDEKTDIGIINEALSTRSSKPYLHLGIVIGKQIDYILPCIDGKSAIKFGLSIAIKKYSDVKDKMIGRVLPPYITSIQQYCAEHIIREGILPVPDDVFDL